MLKLPDGTEVENHAGKEGILFNAFKERLGESSPPNQKFDLGSIITKIDGPEELSVPLTEVEIDEVIRTMPDDRAPGPGGFSGHFIKSCWRTQS